MLPLPLETKDTQKNENQRLGFIKSFELSLYLGIFTVDLHVFVCMALGTIHG